MSFLKTSWEIFQELQWNWRTIIYFRGFISMLEIILVPSPPPPKIKAFIFWSWDISDEPGSDPATEVYVPTASLAAARS